MYCFGFAIVVAYSQASVGEYAFQSSRHSFIAPHFNSHLPAAIGEQFAPFIHDQVAAELRAEFNKSGKDVPQ